MPVAGESATPAVLHFRDGTTEHVQAAPEVPAAADRVTVRREGGTEDVSLSDLKAIFYLSPLPASPTGSPEGTTLAVEFQDGEIIRGTSSEYSLGQSGFLLFPADRSKNDRIFVVNSAVLSIEVERF